MNLLKILLFLICLDFSVIFNLKGQDINYAKQNISKLCSKEFYGRGYTHSGCNNAAKFIANELKFLGAKPIGSSYYQEFTMPVSVINKLSVVNIDNKKLVPGHDYIIHPGSASCKGTFEILWLKYENLLSLNSKVLNNTFLIIDTVLSNDKSYKELIQGLRFSNPYRAKGIIYMAKGETMQIQQDDKIPWVSIEAKSGSISQDSKVIKLNFKSKFYTNYKTKNVIAKINGDVDSSIVFTAHYDHLGELGNTFFPGANDNASGVSMMLDLCRYYSKEKPHYTIYFAFLTGEEVGLVGSSYLAKYPLFSLETIRFLINLDVIGSGEDGITVVNGTEFSKEFELLKEINADKNYLKSIKVRGAANNSDHAPFYNKGVKSFFIYAQGKTGPYHNPNDTPENLSLGGYENIVRLLQDFIRKL